MAAAGLFLLVIPMFYYLTKGQLAFNCFILQEGSNRSQAIAKAEALISKYRSKWLILILFLIPPAIVETLIGDRASVNFQINAIGAFFEALWTAGWSVFIIMIQHVLMETPDESKESKVYVRY